MLLMNKTDISENLLKMWRRGADNKLNYSMSRVIFLSVVEVMR